MRKAKVKDTDCIINVMPKDTGGYIGSDGVTYKESQIDFIPEESPESATIEGWITRSGIGKLAIWNGKPTKRKFYPATCGKPDWGWSGTYPDCMILMSEFGEYHFPSLTFENSPKKDCKRSRALDNEDKLCEHCRLWDSYIPKDSTQEQIRKAIEWQNMPFDVQPDYEDYFTITPIEE